MNDFQTVTLEREKVEAMVLELSAIAATHPNPALALCAKHWRDWLSAELNNGGKDGD